jgi:hypothetical protein
MTLTSSFTKLPATYFLKLLSFARVCGIRDIATGGKEMQREILSDLINRRDIGRRWRRRIATTVAVAGVLVVAGLGIVGVAAYHGVAALLAGLGSPEVQTAGAEVLSRAESVTRSISTGACLDEFAARLDAATWLQTPIAENLAALRESCFGAAPPAESTEESVRPFI